MLPASSHHSPGMPEAHGHSTVPAPAAHQQPSLLPTNSHPCSTIRPSLLHTNSHPCSTPTAIPAPHQQPSLLPTNSHPYSTPTAIPAPHHGHPCSTPTAIPAPCCGYPSCPLTATPAPLCSHPRSLPAQHQHACAGSGAPQQQRCSAPLGQSWLLDGGCWGLCPAHPRGPQPHTPRLRAVRPSWTAPLPGNHLKREQLPVNLMNS